MGRFLMVLAVLFDLIAAGCTYLCGAVVIPNVLNLALWALDNLGRFLFYLLSWGWLPHLPILPLPLDWKLVAVTRNQVWGLLWLGLYVLTRLHFFWKSPLMQKRAPASMMHPHEERWQLVEQCLWHYRQALTRFLTSPIKLRVPPVFQYEVSADGLLITWHRHAPIIPTSLLTRSVQPILGALLALELAKYNSADLFIRAWIATYPLKRPDRGLACIGIFFWLPASLVRSKLYKDWCKERELHYDEFAYLCGQGETLLSILRFNEAHHMQMFATEYEPSTLERIGHLEALLNREYEQMTRLGLQIPEAPEPLLPPAKKRLRGATREAVQPILLSDEKPLDDL